MWTVKTGENGNLLKNDDVAQHSISSRAIILTMVDNNGGVSFVIGLSSLIYDLFALEVINNWSRSRSRTQSLAIFAGVGAGAGVIIA